MASDSCSKVPGLDQLAAQRRSYSSAEPSHQWICVGFGQRRDLLDPGQQTLVLGGGGNGGVHGVASGSSVRGRVIGARRRATLLAGRDWLRKRKNAHPGRSAERIAGPPRASASRRRDSTSPSARRRPRRGSCAGTSTRRLNSATSTPSWLSTRVWTLTVPRSGLDCDSFFSSTSDSQKSVSPWNTGAGCLSSSVARFAIALPLTSLTDMPSASEYTSGPTTTLRPCWDFARVDVVQVQRVVVHRDQAEQVVVGLGHGLRGPVLVHGADLELLQVAAVRVGAARLAGGLLGLDGLGCGLAHGLAGSPVARARLVDV